MRTLIGVLVFLGVAFVPRLLFGGPLTPDAPTNAVALAAAMTPFIATWVMPSWLSLVIYPFAVTGVWIAAGYAADFIPTPGDEPYVAGCGLVFLAVLFWAMFGVLMCVIGRAIGLAIRGEVKNAVVTYIVQILPFSGVVALFLLPIWAR